MLNVPCPLHSSSINFTSSSQFTPLYPSWHLQIPFWQTPLLLQSSGHFGSRNVKNKQYFTQPFLRKLTLNWAIWSTVSNFTNTFVQYANTMRTAHFGASSFCNSIKVCTILELKKKIKFNSNYDCMIHQCIRYSNYICHRCMFRVHYNHHYKSCLKLQNYLNTFTSNGRNSFATLATVSFVSFVTNTTTMTVIAHPIWTTWAVNTMLLSCKTTFIILLLLTEY